MLEISYDNTEGIALWSDVPFEWEEHAKNEMWRSELKEFIKVKDI
ncbi:MAG: hypothetical protein ACP5D2_04570 [Candidatus Nanoarchaeia archaeon]